MFFKSTLKAKPIPEECKGLEIKVQSSTCTGEKTIGFFDRVSGRLLYSELVRSDDDITRFYEKYGRERKNKA